MIKRIEEPWILAGHKIFAEKGPLAITIEGLAREVNKNKSSFYHHFVNLEIFINLLMKYHFDRSKIVIDEERKCKKIVPDLIDVLVKYKYDILFHRQLLINRNNSEFEDLYTKITDQGVDSILKIWNEELGFPSHTSAGRRFLKLGIDNLFQRTTLTNLTTEYLENSFQELKITAFELRNYQ